jgi:hypothetical protein
LAALHERIAEWEETVPEKRFFGDIYDKLITHLVGYQQVRWFAQLSWCSALSFAV